jgi:hypothetical protein
MRPSLPSLTSQPTSQPNWKLSRLSSIDQERLLSTNRPSSVAAIISSSVCGPGSSPTFVIRTIGIRAQPSARTLPAKSSPATAAESRPASTPTQMPSRTACRFSAGVPSSS